MHEKMWKLEWFYSPGLVEERHVFGGQIQVKGTNVVCYVDVNSYGKLS